MNHSVVIKLKINNFMLTFTGISPCFAAKTGNLNLPVVNVKNEFHREISPRKSDFRGEKNNRLNV